MWKYKVRLRAGGKTGEEQKETGICRDKHT